MGTFNTSSTLLYCICEFIIDIFKTHKYCTVVHCTVLYCNYLIYTLNKSGIFVHYFNINDADTVSPHKDSVLPLLVHTGTTLCKEWN